MSSTTSHVLPWVDTPAANPDFGHAALSPSTAILQHDSTLVCKIFLDHPSLQHIRLAALSISHSLPLVPLQLSELMLQALVLDILIFQHLSLLCSTH